MTLCKKCNHDFGLNTIAGICPECNEYTVTTKGKTTKLDYYHDIEKRSTLGWGNILFNENKKDA